MTAGPTRSPTNAQQRPAFGLLLVAAIALLPIQIELSETFRLAPTDLFIAAYLGLRIRSFRHVPKAWSSWHLLVLIAIFLGAAVSFVSTGEISFFVFPSKTVGVLQLFAIVFAVLDYTHTFDDLLRLVRAFVISTTTITGVSIVVLMLQSAGTVELSMFNLDAARLSGLLVDPNAMGGLIGTTLALVLVSAAASHPVLGRRATAVAALVLAIGLFLTYSRSAWLGTGLGLVAGAILLRGRTRRYLSVLAVVGAIAGLSVFLLSGSDSTVNDLASRGDQASERVSIAGDALEDYAGSPVFGIGLGGSEERHGVIVHNTSLWFLSEMGPFGFASILGLFFVLGAWGLRVARGPDPPLAALAGAAVVAHIIMIGVSMGIEATFQRHWWFVWAIIGWCYAADAAASEAGAEPTHERVAS